MLKQRLLYMHASEPNLFSGIHSWYIVEPEAGYSLSLQVDPPECPYASVQQAIVAGWHVIQFPLHRAGFDDQEIDMLGYEYVLEKKVEVSDGD